MPRAPEVDQSVTITLKRPLPSELDLFWEVVEKERTGMFRAPETLAAFVAGWGWDFLPFLSCVEGAPAVLFVLHAPVFDNETGRPVSAWVTTVALPTARGARALACAHAALEQCRCWGYTCLWTGCLVDNRAAQYMARRCGFTRLGPMDEGRAVLYLWVP